MNKEEFILKIGCDIFNLPAFIACYMDVITSIKYFHNNTYVTKAMSADKRTDNDLISMLLENGFVETGETDICKCLVNQKGIEILLKKLKSCQKFNVNNNCLIFSTNRKGFLTALDIRNDNPALAKLIENAREKYSVKLVENNIKYVSTYTSVLRTEYNSILLYDKLSLSDEYIANKSSINEVINIYEDTKKLLDVININLSNIDMLRKNLLKNKKTSEKLLESIPDNIKLLAEIGKDK